MLDQGMLNLTDGGAIDLTDGGGAINHISDCKQGLPMSCAQRKTISMEQLVSMRGMRSKLVQQAPVVTEEECELS